MEKEQEKWICGFWRRIGALFIDSLVLGIFGYILGLFLEDLFVQLGGWGRFIGLVVSLTYFGVMNSALSNGQTIGKKLLNIRVVDASNSTISLPKSFLRYSFIAVPFSLNGAQFTNEVLLSYLMYPLSFIIFGGLFSISYLYIFNRATRQSLHDLAVGTYVVNTEISPEALPAVWKPHLAVVAVLFTIASLTPIFTGNLAESEPFKGLVAVQDTINDNESIKFSTVSKGTNTFTSSGSGTTTTTFVKTQAFLYTNNVEDANLAKHIAQIIITTYPESLEKDVIQVTLIYGYDIGITSNWNSFNHVFNPQDLNALE